MILYGSKAVHLLTGAGSPHTACPVCGTEGEMEYQIFRRHAHIYWLPLFPMNKVGLAQCNHCFKAFEKKEMSEDMLLDYKEVKAEAKGKIWQWTGFFLIVVFGVFAYLSSLQSDAKLNEHLDSPQLGDVYEYRSEDEVNGKGYSLMKVVEVTDDSVRLVENAYQTNLRSGLDELDVDSNYYNDDSFSVAKEEIRNKYNEGFILDVR